jgi:hypothetical protein
MLGGDRSELAALLGIGGDVEPALVVVDNSVEGDLLRDDDAPHVRIVGRRPLGVTAVDTRDAGCGTNWVILDTR